MNRSKRGLVMDRYCIDCYMLAKPITYREGDLECDIKICPSCSMQCG